MPLSARTRANVAALIVSAYILVPTTRGPLALIGSLAIATGEITARRAMAGRPIELLIDGVNHRLPAGGGTVAVGGKATEIIRLGPTILVDGSPTAVGEFVRRGSSQLEVIR